ncbi:MAG: AAA family ATPase [Rhodoferax sp.]|uniref:ExeA family protein n=1 Tax=Rhodoferax sp. TaxID=50421 RepID=UPI002622F8D4|nr:AAA family ATPase [Rhodoferax sp.]MDD2882312.1 AAA family ATPase [Rhodoferax sp.]
MYTQHFGLTQDPFSIAPDPRFLFMSERHREALAHLLFGVAGKGNATGGTGGGFVLLTGDIGTGKTTICRCFLEQIPAGCHVAYIFNPKLTVIELLQSICEEFHVTLPPDSAQTPTAKTCIDALNTFLLQSHAAGQSCVLIIDEAQNLSGDVLEQLRLLTNLETNERKLLQIVLIGQPELRTMLAAPELEQLAQRVIARFHLDALNAAETTHYITHRLGVAGHTGALPFSPKALARIHQLAHGVPRRINLLSGRALLGTWANGQQWVDPAVVNKAAVEVFGNDSARAWASPRHIAALAGLALLVVTAGAGLLLWPEAPKAPPVAKVVAPTRPSATVARAPNVGASTATPSPDPASAAQAPVAGRAPVPQPVADADLKARVRAFQKAQGLEPDGVLGPLTFLQMERALGLTAPSQPTAPR